MKLSDILALLKTFVPILEPLGEQGIEQLFVSLQAQVDKMAQSDGKDLAVILLPALKAFALLELRKLK